MFDYDYRIIEIFLDKFKVNDVVFNGLSNNNSLVEFVLKYCNDNDINISLIDSNATTSKNVIKGNELNILKNFKDFDAIFINGDSNWYTVYNELNIIKKNNVEFPLVLICNNLFPNMRRDSYIDPKIIPSEFLNEYNDELDIDGINIKDGLYHAVDDNSPKNGVFTAIEDFLSENYNVDMLDLKLTCGVTILYSNNGVNQIRIGLIKDIISNNPIKFDELHDISIQNQLLLDYINDNYDFIKNDGDIIKSLNIEIDDKNKLLSGYEEKIKMYDSEINYKNSQINNFDSKLSAKNSEIKHMESILTNTELKINNQKDIIEQMNYQLSEKNNELKKKDCDLNLIKDKYNSQIFQLDNKNYCINCFKEEISNNHVEIQYLKKNTIIKRFLNPFSYIYLIFSSNFNEISINLKLYNALKNSDCFNVGYYLKNNPDLKNGKWFKYFSPELHYVCKGFNENRRFNRKKFNKSSKTELLKYILKLKNSP